ncbi:MAG: hypothetical protein U0136_04465 [Bdellovibrionota bacterium]
MLSATESPSPSPSVPAAPRIEPSAAGWAVGIASLIIALALLYCGELLTSAWYTATLERTFEQSLASKEIDLNFAVDNPRFKSLFADAQKDIKILRPVIALIMLEDAAKAAAYLKHQSLPKTEHNSRLLEQLAALSELNAATEAATDAVARNDAAIDEDFKNYVSLRASVRAFLAGETAVRMPRAGEEDELEELKFYQSGLLAELPVIDRLPDDIKDLAQLVEYYPLQRSGAPAPVANELKARLEELRTQGHNLRIEYLSLIEKQQNLEKESADRKVEGKKLFDGARTALRDMLIALARPSLDPNAAPLYRAASTQLAKLGYELPPL